AAVQVTISAPRAHVLGFMARSIGVWTTLLRPGNAAIVSIGANNLRPDLSPRRDVGMPGAHAEVHSRHTNSRRPCPMTSQLALDPELAVIHAAEYPRFSDAEMARRRAALHRVMESSGVDHLLMCGEQRAGTGVGWLTSWPTTVEAYAIVAPRERQVMHVEWYNHWPLAIKLARDTEVRWGEHRGFDKTLDELKARGARRVGV